MTFVPGELSQRRYLNLTARGVVPVALASGQALAATCEALDVPLPAVIEEG